MYFSSSNGKLSIAIVVVVALPLSHVFGLVILMGICHAKAAMRLEVRFSVERLYAALQKDVTLGNWEEVKAFIKRLAEMSGASIGPSPVEQALEQAEVALQNGDHHQALALYSQILQHEADNKAALAGLVACQLADDDLEAAKETVAALEPEVVDSSEFTSVMAQLALLEKAAEAGPQDELRAKLAADENDHQARFDLAVALQAAGQGEEAADALLHIIEKDRAWNEEAARKQLLTFFEAWGPTDPVTLQARRRLSSLLFS